MYTLLSIFIFFVLYGLSPRLMSYASLIMIGFLLIVKQSLPQLAEYGFIVFLRSLPHWNTFTICMCIVIILILGFFIGYVIAMKIRDHFDTETE